jgi:Holliday junction resolvase
MAATAESKVKAKVVSILKSAGAYYFYPVTGGWGAGAGVPDIIVCYKGLFIGIECKSGANKPTPLQEQNLERIKNAGGISLVIHEGNIHEVYRALGISI